MAGEVVLAFPEPIVPARNVRSTVLLGTIGALRDAGHYEEYAKALEPQVREVLLTSVVGMWLPVEIGLAHYRACDALGLTPETQFNLGRGTFARTKGMLLGTALKMATGVGATPWTVFPHFQRFWQRAYDGGGIRVVQLGPKEASVELAEFAPLVSAYYRNALRGLLCSVVELFCRKAYAHERAGPQRENAIVIRTQWV